MVIRDITVIKIGLACVVLASGCSPYLYKDEIQAFDQRTKALAAAIDQAQTTTAIDYRRRIGFHQLNKEQQRIKLDEKCMDLAERAKSIDEKIVEKEGFVCRLVTIDPVTGAEDNLKIDPLRDNFAKVDEITKALDAYTKALLAVTHADDRKALEAAADKLCGAVNTLAAAAAPAAGAAGAVCSALANAYGAHLDRRRYQVLRAGVVKADSQVMPRLAMYLKESLWQARNNRIASITHIAPSVSRALVEGTRASRAPDTGDLVYTDSYWGPLNQVFASAKDLEQLLTLNPAAVVESFQKAHTDLATAINSRKGQSAAVLQSLEVLSEQIQALRKAFKPAAG